MGGRINGWLKRRYRRTYRDGGEVFRFSWNEPERVCHMRWQSARPKIVHFSGVQVRRERGSFEESSVSLRLVSW